MADHNSTANDPHMTEDGTPVMMLPSQPGVGWGNASIEWGPYWDATVYTTIGVNAVLIIWTIVNMIYILTKGRKLVSRKYLFTLNLMVWIFAITKLLYYSIDPRGIHGIMPPLAGNLLLNSNFPTLTVGFFMLYAALRQCTVPNNNLLPFLMKTKCIVAFIIVCFAVSYSTDIVVILAHSMQLMMLVCQIFYILWGFLFSVLYSALVIKYRNAVTKARRRMERSCYRRGHCRRGFNQRNLKKIPVCVKITCVTALLFLLYAILTIFLVLMEIGQYKAIKPMQKMCDDYRQTWPFFGVQLTFSVVEHSMAILLAVAGTQPLKWLRLSAVVTMPTNITIPSSTSVNTVSNIFSIEQDMETSFTDITSVSQSRQTLKSSAGLPSTPFTSSHAIPSAV